MNNNIKENYVSYENAVLLKEKEFRIETSHFYLSNKSLNTFKEESYGEREYYFELKDFYKDLNQKGWIYDKDGDGCFGCKLDEIKWFNGYSCPTTSLCLKWLRENFGIHVFFPIFFPIGHGIPAWWTYHIIKIDDSGFFCDNEYSSEEYEETEQEAIHYILTNLI